MRFLCLLTLVFLSSAVQSHQLSTGYLNATINSTGQVELQWQARFYDWEQAVGLDQDGNGELLWGEVLEGADRLEQYAREHLILARGDHECQLTFSGPWKTEQHFREGYLVLPMRAQCPIAGNLTLRYHAFFESQREHKLIATVEQSGAANGSQTRVLSKSQQMVSLSSADGSVLNTVGEFVKEGVIHIWIGLDHILFLLSLLLTCVLVRHRGRWQSEHRVRHVVANTFWIVTAFTLAHSVTLTATALGWVSPSSQWVEVVIAASVALAALNNLYPVIRRLSLMTFIFGLIHGFGFAGVLGELGVPADQTLLTVLAFNLGVELGQLSIVLLILPILMAARHYRWYPKFVMPALSLMVASVAILWVIERI